MKTAIVYCPAGQYTGAFKKRKKNSPQPFLSFSSLPSCDQTYSAWGLIVPRIQPSLIASTCLAFLSQTPAILLGLLSSGCLSVLCSLVCHLQQTWIYFWHYWKRDPMALKFFVAFIIVMDALDTILSAYAIYWYLVLNFGNVENLDYVMWAMNMEFAIGPEAIVCAFVQIFYARQVFIVSRSIICPIFIVVSITISFSFGLLFVVKELALRRFSWFHSSLWVMCVGVAAVAMTDLLIAAAMCWSLYRKRTGFARTDSIITTLMAYSINSGLLTSILSLGVIISSVVSPSSMIWLAFLWVMGKCSVNSLLAM
ncbi:hypothetical protein EDB84DRAFT_1082591 [Lactarius hengduanensis]|nr:hypothetical protein EDB84DRAFT_1082591 [Lactarius hengduanensis]